MSGSRDLYFRAKRQERSQARPEKSIDLSTLSKVDYGEDIPSSNEWENSWERIVTNFYKVCKLEFPI